MTDGTVLSIVRTSDVVFIAGSFTELMPCSGGGGVPRSNIAALDAVTGEPTDWKPDVNGAVHALALSQDGSTLFVGGECSPV